MIYKKPDKRLFAFLKDRNIFNGGRGKGGLKEALSRMEQKTMYKDAERRGHKKRTCK